MTQDYQTPPDDPRRSDYLRTPIVPIEPEREYSYFELMETYAGGSFGRRDLGVAARIWWRMVNDKAMIFMGLSGAMVPAGISQEIQFLLRNRLIDALVSTGANLSHDLGESLGVPHYRGQADVDDDELGELMINRVHDTFYPEEGFIELDEFVWQTFAEIPKRETPFSPREIFSVLGKKLNEQGRRPGVLSTAAACGVPVFSQALADSELGVAFGSGRDLGKYQHYLDPTFDNAEMRDIVRGSRAAGWESGEVLLGGGVTRNAIQQSVVSALHLGEAHPGHKYGVLITTDTPYAGGASGSTFAETKSWRKFAEDADAVTVHADATIAFPLLELALADRIRHGFRRKYVPRFDFSGPRLQVSFPE